MCKYVWLKAGHYLVRGRGPRSALVSGQVEIAGRLDCVRDSELLPGISIKESTERSI